MHLGGTVRGPVGGGICGPCFTPDGETIIWVSDYCYVSISSRSLTQKEIHDARKGVRMCVLAQFGDEKKARDDLFDSIKRPPPPQEPGCDKDGVGQSCGR